MFMQTTYFIRLLLVLHTANSFKHLTLKFAVLYEYRTLSMREKKRKKERD